MIKAIIFDFDGVLVDSVQIKGRAFAALFQDSPEHVRRDIVAFHCQNAGLSRYEKIAQLHLLVYGRPITPAELDERAAAFARLCVEEIVRAPAIRGAREFLAAHAERYHCYIASGTVESELRTIVERRGLAGFFKGVFGFPHEKSAICQAILERGGYQPLEAVVVGDSLVDYEAARECGTHFVARLDSDSQDALTSYDLPLVLPDLHGLGPLLEALADPCATPAEVR